MTHRPHTSHWGRLATLDSPRSFAAAETWRDNVYILGGGDGSQWFSSVLRCVALPLSMNQHYSVTGQVCCQVFCRLCICRQLSRSGSKQTHLADILLRYAATSEEHSSLVYLFLPFLHKDACILTVQAGAIYNLPRLKAAATAMTNSQQIVPHCCRNDTALHHSRWSPVAPMKTERGSLAAVTVGDYIYAIGGGKPNMQYDTVER